MSIATQLRYAAARWLMKANSSFAVVSPWVRASFLEPTFERLTSEAYQKNSVVTACLSAYTFMFPEPPLLIWDDEGAAAKSLPDHPLRRLLRNPNPVMGEDELWQYTVAYMGIGGYSFWVSARDARGQLAEGGTYPYHAGQVRVVPGGPTWVRGYEFHTPEGDWEPIDENKYKVVQFKWPLPDLTQPWQAQPPLRSASAAVDSDSELDRYLYALLKNDAVPPTYIKLRENQEMGQEEKDVFRAKWAQQFGGNNRGGIAILDDGMELGRIALNLQELAFDALRRVPETRIAAAFRVPPILAGLGVGLEHSTYSNYEQARKAFTQDALVPLWRAVAAEVQSALGAEYGGVVCRHDLSGVASLQEDVNEQWKRVNTAFISGYLGMKEARAALGLPAEPPTDDLFMLKTGVSLTPGAMLGQTMPALPAPVEAPVKQFKRIRRDDIEDLEGVMDAARRLVEEVGTA